MWHHLCFSTITCKVCSLVFEWSKRGWMLNGLVLECHMNVTDGLNELACLDWHLWTQTIRKLVENDRFSNGNPSFWCLRTQTIRKLDHCEPDTFGPFENRYSDGKMINIIFSTLVSTSLAVFFTWWMTIVTSWSRANATMASWPKQIISIDWLKYVLNGRKKHLTWLKMVKHQ